MNLNLLFTLEAIFIIMLIVITLKQDPDKLFQCSRDRSKIVRDVIYKKFMPVFVRYETNLSHECPFHPDREFLWWPTDENDDYHKQADNSFWTCPFCGADFYCSERLIFHWDTEHRYSQQYREDLVCLADYCAIFRCDVIMKKMLQRRKRFLNYLSFGGKSNDYQQQHQMCDQEQMNLLQEMCFNVIQQCTIGVEINISSQTIWTLRKELTDSLCSYLTCEHYNDDLFTDDSPSQKVPIIFFSTVGIIMLSGFVLLYYIIWNALKKGLINENEETICNKEKESIKNDDNKPAIVNRISKKVQTQSNSSNHHNTSDKFFENIFEFHREKYEDSFEYSDFDINQVSKFQSKLHAINSIIEEEEEESEMDLSVNSYPNISRKFTKRSSARPKTVQQHSIAESNIFAKKVKNDNLKKELKTSQEICFQELPMKFHSKYVQPIKHQPFSEQYHSYSGPKSETFATLSNKSRSYSHSQLRKMFPHPRRQLSVEDWHVSTLPAPETQPPPPLPLYHHASQVLTRPHQQPLAGGVIPGSGSGGNMFFTTSGPPQPQQQALPQTLPQALPPPPPPAMTASSIEWNGRPRISKSAMSYHMMHPSKRREIYAASKTNSDASIASGSSRYTVYSNPSSLKT